MSFKRLAMLTVLLSCAAAGCSSEGDGPRNQAPVLANALAVPGDVARGGGTLLTVEASDSDGRVVSVTADLTPLGGASASLLADDGLGADAVAGDGTWSLWAGVASSATPAVTAVAVAAVDDAGAVGSGWIPVTVKANHVPVLANPLATPTGIRQGGTTRFTVAVADDGWITSVVVTNLIGTLLHTMVDDGTGGDATAGDGTFSCLHSVPLSEPVGGKTVIVSATDNEGDSAAVLLTFSVVANLPPAVSNGAVAPAAPNQGDAVLFTANASDPDGTVVSVTADLSSVGGSAAQPLFDDGTNGDAAPDGTWSFAFAIPLGAATGAKSLAVTAADDSAATGTGAIVFTLGANPGPALWAGASSPDQATGEDTVTLVITASDPQGVSSVTVDLTPFGGSGTQAMVDDGTNGDAVSGDGTYTCQTILSAHVSPGLTILSVTAQDGASAVSGGSVPVQVLRLGLETTNFMYSLSGSGANNMIMAGEQGFGWHFDGSSWRMVNLKNPNSSKRQSGTFVFSDGRAFTVGQTGSGSVFDGSMWSFNSVNPTGGANEVYDVWGPSFSLAFAAGTSGSATQPNLFRWNGSAWAPETSGTTQSLRGVWGSAGTDVVAVGLNNTVIHYDGSTWNAETVAATYNDFFGVWGDATGSTYFAVTADGGTIGLTPYNGEIWKGVGGPPNLTWTSLATVAADLYDVHGTSLTDIWAVGSGGTILHSTDGLVFSAVTSGTTENLYSVWANSTSDVWACGGKGVVLRYNGTVWSVVVPPSSYPDDAYGVSVPTATDAWVVDMGGGIRRYNAGAWTAEYLHSAALRGVWAPAGSTADVFAVGDGGVVLHRTGGSWGLMVQQPPASAGTLYTAWGTGAASFFAAGANASATGAGIWDFSGSWSALHTGFTGTAGERIYALGGDPAGTAVWAGSNDGKLYLYQGGQAWADVTATLGSGPFSGFNGIWASSTSDVYAVGNNGQAFHYDGSTWSALALPGSPTAALMDVCGTSASDVYVVGTNMLVYRFNGTSWKALPFQCTGDLFEADAYGSLVLFTGENGQTSRLQR